MGMMVIRHKVADYAKWRPLFDAHTKEQRAAGLTHPRVLRSADDKNELVIIFDDMDTKKAKEFRGVAQPERDDEKGRRHRPADDLFPRNDLIGKASPPRRLKRSAGG